MIKYALGGGTDQLEHLLNYANGVQVKLSKERGRGIFAEKDIKKGELIIVEKPIAVVEKMVLSDEKLGSKELKKLCNDRITELTEKCLALYKLKGIEALRLSYLCDGENINESIPPDNLYVSSAYKKYKLKKLSERTIANIVVKNNFGGSVPSPSDENAIHSNALLLGLVSFMNHSKHPNVSYKCAGLHLHLVYADKDIQKGDELCIDYVRGVDD